MSEENKTVSLSNMNAIAGLVVSILLIVGFNWGVTSFYVDMNINTLKEGFARVVKSVDKLAEAQQAIKDKNSARDQETLRIKLKVENNTRRIDNLEANPH